MVGRLRWPSWFLPDHARPLPTLFTLTQRPSNDLTRLPNALSTTALHSRPLPIVLNSSNQPGTVGDTSTKFTDLPGPSKTHPRSFPTFLRLHKTSPDHQGRERSAVRSAKCDRGLRSCRFHAADGTTHSRSQSASLQKWQSCQIPAVKGTKESRDHVKTSCIWTLA